MRSRVTTTLLLLAAATSCAGAPPPPPEKPRDPASDPANGTATPPSGGPSAKFAPPDLRLPKNVVPTKVSATLTLVPSDPTTRGSIDLDVTVNDPTRILWLNAVEIEVDEARLEQGGATLKPQVAKGGDDFIGLKFEQELARGPARVHLEFRGKISDTSDRGVFRQESGGATYIYTQFENIEARRAFPCFDEPSFKIPWQLTIRVKPGDTPISNTPVVSEASEGGYKVVRFAETKPIPSYLVAFAVGPFDVIDAGKAGRNKVPLRIVAPRGQGPEAAFAAGSTGKLFSILEDYFDIPYPYEKMDVVAIPRLATFGAMENVGMITISARLSLSPPAKETPAFQSHYVDTMAHELAHQWFGDLVTMAWWDDIWLNEGFASWMGNKTAERARPEFRFEMDRVRGATFAMSEDSLTSARKIRQEIETKDDIQNAFDGITYVKGASVISMFESWVGAEPFRKGIQRYLKTRAMGNATSADFLADVSEGSGKDLRAAFATFLDRPGVPLVSAKLSCEKGKGPAKLSLTQERYLPLGSKGDAAAPAWSIPICARYEDGKSTSRACGLLSQKTGEIELPSASCPTWFALKEGGAGYFRAAYAPSDLDALLDDRKAKLTIPERISVIEDVNARVRDGKLPIGEALLRLPLLVKSDDPQLILSAFFLVAQVREAHVDEALQPKLARFISSSFGKQARALGLRSRPSDSLETRRLRSNLVPFVAARGEEKALIEEATKLAWKWLDDPSSLEEDAIPAVIGAAASHGDRALFDRLRAEAKKAKGAPGRRLEHLLEGLSSFRDPALVREALSIALTSEVEVLDVLRLFFQDSHNAGVVLEFMKQNLDALLAKLPTELRSSVIETLYGVCDAKGLADVEALYKERAASIVGGPRTAAQVQEAISLCIAQDALMRPSLKAFLEKSR